MDQVYLAKYVARYVAELVVVRDQTVTSKQYDEIDLVLLSKANAEWLNLQWSGCSTLIAGRPVKPRCLMAHSRTLPPTCALYIG